MHYIEYYIGIIYNIQIYIYNNYTFHLILLYFSSIFSIYIIFIITFLYDIQRKLINNLHY